MPRYQAVHDAPWVWSIHDSYAHPPICVATLDWRAASDDDEKVAPEALEAMAKRIARLLSINDPS